MIPCIVFMVKKGSDLFNSALESSTSSVSKWMPLVHGLWLHGTQVGTLTRKSKGQKWKCLLQYNMDSRYWFSLTVPSLINNVWRTLVWNRWCSRWNWLKKQGKWEKDDKFDVEGYIKGNTDYWCLSFQTSPILSWIVWTSRQHDPANPGWHGYQNNDGNSLW